MQGNLLAIRKNVDGYYEEGEIGIEKEDDEMSKKIFISHASADKGFVERIVDLLIDLGVREDQIFCSSVPGFGIPLGNDIYEYLREEFVGNELHVIFILSNNYYASVACMNEMGAAYLSQFFYIFLLYRNGQDNRN